MTRTGARRLIQWKNTALRSTAGDAIGTASIGEDVTERKHAEDLHAGLAAIVEPTNDAIIGKTLDGVMTTWKRGAEKPLGDPAGGGDRPAAGPGSSRTTASAEEPERLARLRRGERVTHFETVRRHKNGTLIDVSLTISPVYDAQGRIVGASKIARDITEHKRADVKIRRLNRVYAVLSSINALIVRVRNRDVLFGEACRIAVEAGEIQARVAGDRRPLGAAHAGGRLARG